MIAFVQYVQCLFSSSYADPWCRNLIFSLFMVSLLFYEMAAGRRLTLKEMMLSRTALLILMLF